MSKVNVSQLSHANNSGDPNIQLYADGSTSIRSLSNTAENMLMNSGMIVKQRDYNYPANAPVAFGVGDIGGTFTLDRWRYWKVAATGRTDVTQDTSDLPPGFSCGYRATVGIPTTGAAAWYEIIAQCIEGWNSAVLSWGTANGRPLTISFWAQTNLAGKYAIWLRNNQASDASQTLYCTTYEIPTADTWTYCTVTIPAPPVVDGVSWATGNAIGVEIGWSLAGSNDYQQGTADTWNLTADTPQTFFTSDCVQNWSETAGNYFRLTGTVANVGEVPTPWVQKNAQLEQLECCRYFYKYPDSTNQLALVYDANSANGRILQLCHPTPMRTAPTYTWASSTNWSGAAEIVANAFYTYIYGAPSVTTTTQYLSGLKATAELGLDPN